MITVDPICRITATAALQSDWIQMTDEEADTLYVCLERERGGDETSERECQGKSESCGGRHYCDWKAEGTRRPRRVSRILELLTIFDRI
jgi:hypothetical protein